jgi:DNA-directed RNA polymerase specialized sigma subunit
METKQYLNQILRLDRQIKNKLAEIYQLRTMAESITVATDKERVDGSGDKDKLGCIMARIVDMEREVDKMVDKRCDIVAQIDGMEDTESYDVLAKIYILDQDLKAIAIEKNISYKTFSRLHKKALKEFEEKYLKCPQVS